jgi:uncharacterized membrane protein
VVVENCHFAQVAGGVMTFRLGSLKQYWLIALVVLWIVVAAVLLLIAPKPTVEQRTASTEQPGASESGQPTVLAEDETLTAQVVEVLEEGSVDLDVAGPHPYQRLLLHIEKGSLAGQEVIVEHGTFTTITEERLLHPGDRVYLERVGDRLYISDYVRTGSLFWILALFMGLVVLVGRGRGLRSLVGTLFSLLIIFAFVVPQILAGWDPVTVSVIGSIVMLTVSTYLVYGWNPKAHAAVAGIMLSLVLTGVLAWLLVGWSRLTGVGTEESMYLVMELGPGVQLKGVVLAGIIIGSLGVLDDICVGQASAIFELIKVNRNLGWMELFRHSLNIGRDHIAATVNTLLLAYVGASLPLMLAFTIYQEPFLQRINREPIAEEIVRTLVGSIGLVLAVPITGLIAGLLARWMVRREMALSG